MDTIFALASARGKAGVAVVRVSGPHAVEALSILVDSVPEPRVPSLRTLRSEHGVLDEALVLVFAEGQSFTGEETVELHLHGSTAIVSAVLRALGELPRLRGAEPGEFTRRALENDRLDIAQVEGLADLIESETEAQRRQALKVFSGAIGEKVERWRKDLIRAAALLEATIDFVDEDVPTNVFPEVEALLAGVSGELSAEIAGSVAAERIRDGFEVAIVGPPNAGKSTLLNALAGRQAAITSEIAGTTRDVIEVKMDLAGLPVTLLDTAGVRDTEDTVESLGVDLALSRAETADLRIILLASPEAEPIVEPLSDDIVVSGKLDTTYGANFSALTGEGIERLIAKIVSRLEQKAMGAGIAIRERHRVAMQRAEGSLGIARVQISVAPELVELIAEELRSAIQALDALVGRVDVEDLLDEIFLSFCVGK